MKKRELQGLKWVLLGIALVVVLWASSQQARAQAYMVRVVVLEQIGAEYAVAVLYQNPEAAANSAEVQASVQLASAQGESLAAAFQMISQQLEGAVSYQLSDYLLLAGDTSKQMVEEYAQLVQTAQCGRYSAKMSVLAQEISLLSEIFIETPSAAQSLLEVLELDGQNAPALYEISGESIVMPLLSMQQDGTLETQQRAYHLFAEGATEYDAAQTQLYLLLSSGRGEANFLFGETAFTISTRLRSQSGALTGVTDTLSQVCMPWQEKNAAAQQASCEMTLYAVISQASDVSQVALANMELYLAYLADSQPALLAQLGVSSVEVHLICPAQLW